MEKHALEDRRKRVQFDDPANIEFTSGTTGRSKAVILSHHNIVNNANFCGQSLGFNHQVRFNFLV
jgi:fatty-acyl-CoA synthase